MFTNEGEMFRLKQKRRVLKYCGRVSCLCPPTTASIILTCVCIQINDNTIERCTKLALTLALALNTAVHAHECPAVSNPAACFGGTYIILKDHGLSPRLKPPAMVSIAFTRRVP